MKYTISLAAVFSLVHLGIAFFLMVGLARVIGTSLHLGFAYAALSLTLLWSSVFLLERQGSKYRLLYLALVGFALLGLVYPLVIGAEKLDDFLTEQTVRDLAGARVFGIEDETLFSPQGNPIGIRLRYSARFPRNRVYPAAPTVRPGDAVVGMASFGGMRVVRTRIDPPPVTMLSDPEGTGTYAEYRAGTEYHFVVETVPRFLIPNHARTRFCVFFYSELDRSNQLAQSGAPVPYVVRFYDLGENALDGKAEQATKKSYSLREFYEGAIKDGVQPCPSPWKDF